MVQNKPFSCLFWLGPICFNLEQSFQVIFFNPFFHIIYTHLNTLKKKCFRKTLWEKVKLLKISNFTFFHMVFYSICILKSLTATFQLSSAASLILEWSQNGVLRNGLNKITRFDLLNGVLRHFQQCFSHITATAHINHVFPGFHQYQAGALKCLSQEHSPEKPEGSSAASTQDP